MADLYQRARGYAERCEQVLEQIEQTIELWDPEHPDTPPSRFEP
jgi:exonuclease VII small subunit